MDAMIRNVIGLDTRHGVVVNSVTKNEIQNVLDVLYLSLDCFTKMTIRVLLELK